MSKKKLNRLLLLILVALFFSAGCAHKPKSNSQDASTGYSQTTGGEIDTISTDPVVENNVDSIGDEFDQFDDEFETDKIQVADPLAPLNRAMYHFNDKLYFWLLKPVAKGYKAVVPETARVGVKNFFSNLLTPVRLANCLFQGKIGAAGAELGKFVVNTTEGILGFRNAARKYPELNPGKEDLGQTLATYGIGNGFYIVWPILGPSTLRDTLGLIGDLFLNPIAYYVDSPKAYIGIRAYDILNNTSLRIGDYEAIKEASPEPYVAIRNGYIQHREKLIAE
jgi:phospholipid-binding lipoprotein MlaA